VVPLRVFQFLLRGSRILLTFNATSGADPLLAFANVRYGDLNLIIPGANADTAESPYRGLCSRHSWATVVATISPPIQCLQVIYTV
jgi:hypothetical protein